MRTEKIEKWGDTEETLHVYSWDSPHKLDYVVEVDERGLVMVRDRDGHTIHVAHILELIDSAKVVDHQMKREKLSGIRNEILAEITTK